MRIELECIADLAKSGNCSFTETTPYTLDEGKTVADLVMQAKLSPQDIETVIVNNTVANMETSLSDGDKVELVPVFGSG